MYLEHFGLNEPPFRITPVTEFFFSGASRGEILDALIYSISEVEGIVKVSGEVGSGKTMLCRMLLEKLPGHIEPIYLANPSLSREEMLYAIADGLGLNITDERVGIIMQNIQNKLEEKAREGKRVAVLVDEAHAMPPDTLEELRLLYNLQVGNAKLLQIILFGQPELNEKLSQPNMRQLKDRIVHHFNMQPLSRDIIENYLMFRMRAANYRGPHIFSLEAIKLITSASNGLMRRVNILADKSLLAAFVEDTHNIEARHVQAAMRDSELKSSQSSLDYKLLGGILAIFLSVIGLGVWWVLDPSQTPPQLTALANSGPAQGNSTAQPSKETATKETNAVPNPPQGPTIKESPSSAMPADAIHKTTPLATTGTASALTESSKPTANSSSLFEQRMEAGRNLLKKKNVSASIQLFYNTKINTQRIEKFLARADGINQLSEIYLLPAKFGDKNGLRILYGAYPSVDAALKATESLPKRYKEAFATSIFIF